MKALFLFIFTLILSVNSHAQLLLIKDRSTNTPIAGASLTATTTKTAAFTDAKGLVDIASFLDADTITIRSLGHQKVATTVSEIKKLGFTIFLEDSNLSLDVVIISANRWEQNLRELPNSIATIDQASIRLQNPQSAADLLGISNKVFVQKSQLGGGSPMLRGFATNRVLLVVDGVRMNNAIYRSGNIQNVISLDANAIEETEIIFGPGSVMYGSDAIGGVIDFHTLSPQFSTTSKAILNASAFSRYSTANEEHTTHADFNIGLKKWAFTTSLTLAEYDNLKMGTKGPTEYTRPTYVVRQNDTDIIVTNSNKNVQVKSGYNQHNIMQKIRFSPSTAWDINYAFHYSESSDVPRYDRLILKDTTGNLVQGEWYYGPQKWMMSSLKIKTNTATKLFETSKITVAHQVSEESRHSRNFGSNERTNRFEKVNALSFNIDLDKQLSSRINFFYGTEYVYNQVGSNANRLNITTREVQSASTRYPDGATWQSMAIYLNAKIKLHPSLILQFGNRFSNICSSATFDTAFFDLPTRNISLTNSAVNSSIGLVYNPTSNWKFYTNLSSGFRAPNIDDIGKVFDSSPGNVVVPNPNLKPENAYSTEIGLATILNEKIKIDAAVFYSILNNAIARADFTFNGEDSIAYDGTLSQVQAQQNISSIKVGGLQVGLAWMIAKCITLSSNVNYQQGKERDPRTNRNFATTHVAPLFGATHLVYSNSKFVIDFNASYNGEISYRNLALSERADAHLYAKDNNGNPYAPSWFTLNAKSSYTMLKKITIDLGIENILNKRYRPYSSGITAPGRNFIVSLRAKI